MNLLYKYEFSRVRQNKKGLKSQEFYNILIVFAEDFRLSSLGPTYKT